MRRRGGEHWSQLEHERVAPWWRVWGMLQAEITPLIPGSLFGKQEAWEVCLKVLAERPRRRKLPQLPPEVIAVFYHGDARQQADMPLAA